MNDRAKSYVDHLHYSERTGSPRCRPHCQTGAGPSRACFNVPSIPKGLDIRMMARVAGRSDRMSE